MYHPEVHAEEGVLISGLVATSNFVHNFSLYLGSYTVSWLKGSPYFRVPVSLYIGDLQCTVSVLFDVDLHKSLG